MNRLHSRYRLKLACALVCLFGAPDLKANDIAQSAPQVGWWGLEFLTCVQDARTLGYPFPTALQLCQGAAMEGQQEARETSGDFATIQTGTWGYEFLTCVQDARTLGYPPGEAFQACQALMQDSESLEPELPAERR